MNANPGDEFEFEFEAESLAAFWLAVETLAPGFRVVFVFVVVFVAWRRCWQL